MMSLLSEIYYRPTKSDIWISASLSALFALHAPITILWIIAVYLAHTDFKGQKA